jgi:DNA primase
MASFSQQFIDELLSRVSIVQLLSSHTKLQKRGQSHTGLCPFHQEKTPSFHVNDEKGLYHCFGCGASGNALSFLTQHQGITFPEAVKELALAHHLPLPLDTPEQQEKENLRAQLLNVMEKTTLWFQHNLYADNAESRYALQYLLKERKLNHETIKLFRIGWAPQDRNALVSHLSEQGCLFRDIQTLGLTGTNNALSFFHSRLMIPVTNIQQQVIAFGGRFLGDHTKAQTGKYINSKTSPLFDKNQVLFNSHVAKKARTLKKPIILVEGYMDVIVLHQHGFTLAVAALGTAASVHHIQTLWNFSHNPVVCFDGDNAGKQASERLLNLALPLISAQKSLAFAQLPDGYDPDSFLSSGKNQEFQKLIDNPQPLSQKLWHIIQQKYPLHTPEHFALIEKETLEHTSEIKDSTLQKHLRADIKNQLWNLRRNQNHTTPHNITPQSNLPNPSLSLLTERKTFLALLTFIQYPNLLNEFSFLLSHLQPQNPSLKRLQEKLLEALWTQSFSSQEDIVSFLSQHKLEHALHFLQSLNLYTIAPHLSQHNPGDASKLLNSIQQRLLEHLKKQEQIQKLSETLSPESTQAP